VYQTRIALLKEIDCMRNLMVATAGETGFTSEETIRCSQELDRLIFDYQKLCKETEIQRIRGKLLFRQMILLTKKHYVLRHA
jgi:stage 0 sporulation regulatory protein